MNTAQESNNAIKYIVLSILFLFIVVIAVQNLFLSEAAIVNISAATPFDGRRN